MRLRHIRAAIAAAVFAACSFAQAAPVKLDDLLRRPQYDDMSISPGGDYLAATVMLDDRSVLAIVRRSDMQITGRIDPGKDGYVTGAYWVSNDRVFASTAKRFGLNADASMLPMLFGMDADGRHGDQIWADVVDALPRDDDRMIVRVCHKQHKIGCWTRAKRVRTDLKGRPEDLADAPVPNADFAADSEGRVRFAWASDPDDIQQLYVRGVEEDAEWQLLNDEAKSGVEVVPIGTSADSQRAWLRSERKEGPDAIVEYDFASGTQREVLRDERADPADILLASDTSEPISAVFRDGQPRARFWNTQHPDALLQKDLDASFAGESALVTSDTRDGSFAVVTVTSDREPGRYYLLDRKSGDIKLLNRSRPWLDPKSLGAMAPVEIQARDGLKLRAFLAKPPGAGNAPLPLVVVPHGGPYWIRDDWAFDEDTQVLATRGYAVLRVNFRGSGGYGRAFIESGMGEWGGKMQDDLTDATKWAIAQGIADPKRICIFGASYGGYAALMGAVKEPELYRCTIGVAGVYDLDLMYRWGDIQRSKYGENYLERAIGRDQAKLAQRSPARRVKEIRASVMLVHGGRDFRVSPEHAKAMRERLDAAGVKYEGYFPSYEAHGIADRENRKEYYEKVLAFLDKHIGKP